MHYNSGYKMTHGRRTNRTYQKGETFPRYGIAQQLNNGTYQFMTEYAEWNDDFAYTWLDPPYHYLNFNNSTKPIHPSAFIVNFNKPNAPRPKFIK